MDAERWTSGFCAEVAMELGLLALALTEGRQ